MLQNRPPIIVILGHVDHGKTTLLDYLRKSNVAARESGGITQHIRSFQLIAKDQQLMTFIDTPGHSAFAAMRARGSNVADIAVLVVAADDGVMPQTKQSVEFIKHAQIPYLVALTKSDLPTSNPDKVKTQLTEIGVVVEDFGGDISCVIVSGKTGAGIPDLLETLSLLSQLHPNKTDPSGQLQAVVLESSLDSKKGPLATLIIKNGTLKVGDALPLGKVRALIDSNGQNIKEALPSTPVEILGLNIVPAVGSQIGQEIAPAPVNQPLSHESIEPLLSIILRADVAGSLEAILSSLPPLVNVLGSGTGDFVETDVDRAKTGSAVLVGFNVKVTNAVAKLAEVDKVKIYNFKIIYELLDQIDKLTHSQITETIQGKAEIIAQFKIGPDRIAGGRVTEGIIQKNAKIRLVRGDTIIGDTRLKSLKAGKADVTSVKSGLEFGAVFSPYLDFRVADHIIAIES